MTDARLRQILYISFVLTGLLSAFSLWQRYQVESQNRAVGIVADADTIQALAASEGVAFDAALVKLKGAGLSGVVLSEETIGDLVADGRAAVGPHMVRLTEEDQQLRSRVARGLTNRFRTFIAPGDATIPIGELSPGLARTASLGIDPVLASAARAQDLIVVARLGNPLGGSDTYVRESIKWIAELGATAFLPQGEQVLGRRDSLNVLVEQLKASKVLYATPEFAKIGGDASVVGSAPEIVVRLHSAQTQELDKLGPADAVERFGKAAAERNQRILLLRPLTSAGDKPLETFGDFLSKVRKQIEREGYSLAPPHAFSDSGVPAWLFPLIALSTLPAFIWLWKVEGRGSKVALGLLVFVALLAPGTALPVARGPFALLAATAYPLVAYLLLAHAPVGIFVGYLRTSMVSLLGGFCVAGLLNGLPFFVKADAFEGVKIAHFLPVALIGFYFLARKTDLRALLRTPIFWQQAALGLVILVGMVFIAARTGNDNPAGVSGIELKFRALLDQFLYVRPRTKEFLLGHPAMIVALGMLASKREYGGWLALVMMISALGQTSMVNTMCHLHTPITLSLARIGVGWILGGIIGAMVWGVLARFAAQRTN